MKEEGTARERVVFIYEKYLEVKHALPNGVDDGGILLIVKDGLPRWCFRSAGRNSNELILLQPWKTAIDQVKKELWRIQEWNNKVN